MAGYPGWRGKDAEKLVGKRRLDINKKTSKMRNKQALSVDGHKFPSKKERDRYEILRLLERAGAIRDLEIQKIIRIEIGGIKIMYASGRQMQYRADFAYFDVGRNRSVIEDTKGYRTRVYLMKKALLAAMGLHIEEI